MMELCCMCGSKINKGREKFPQVIANLCSAMCFRIYLLNEAGPVINSKTARKYKTLEWIGQENMIYKSSYEERFAGFLREEGIDFLYEPLIFRFGSLVYIPDFLVYNNPATSGIPKGSVFVEIKGLWEHKALDKVVAMQPHFPLLVMNRSILMGVTRK